MTLEVLYLIFAQASAPDERIALESAPSVPRFDPAEFVLRIEKPTFANPFTEASFSGDFREPGGTVVSVSGFADSEDGSAFRLRFSPREGGAYAYVLHFRGGGIEREFKGELRSEPSDRPGPVVVDPKHPKHFLQLGSGKPFYHLGYTAYHLLDPTNDLGQIDATIDYCAAHGFNKIRFLLTGYPRDFDERTSRDEEHGVPDPWKAPNYGSKPGQVNPLPAWQGKPHSYDFARFDPKHWQRADHAVRKMRERGIVATCIIIIEKQDLPRELGRLTENELLLYRYAAARLSAFDNVWWDLGNEHNEFRDVAWGNSMGAILKEADPYDRLASAHGYAEFLYPEAKWADFIVTQQYGDEKTVHDWALRYLRVAKPYVDEEYGYEGNFDKPGHGQNADWVRRCHWSIAMAGGYATYGDWSEGVSYFYMGEPGPGKAALQLKHLRSFFEELPFPELEPRDDLTSGGFCLASPPRHHVIYLPRGGKADLDLRDPSGNSRFEARWFDPREGKWSAGPALKPGKNSIAAPSGEDWILRVEGKSRTARP